MKFDKNDKENNKIEYASIIGIVILVLLMLCIAFRDRYGFNVKDEAYYLAMPDRIWKGDWFIQDEWHPTQLFFLLITPIYSLFRMLSSDGTYGYLFLRWSADVVSLLVATFLFVRHKKENYYAALGAAVIILLYSRGNLRGFKYYDAYVLLLVLSILVYEIAELKRSRWLFELCGILLVLVSVCMPYFGFALGLGYVIFGTVYCVSTELRARDFSQNVFHVFLGMLSGGLTLIVYFLIQSKDIPRLIRNIPFLLQDEGHSAGPLYYLFNILKDVVHVISLPGAILIIMSCMWTLLRRKGASTFRVVCFIAFVWRIAVRYKETNQIYIIFVAYLLPCVLESVIKSKYTSPQKVRGIRFIIIGMIASICFSAASDAAAQSFSTGMVLAAVGTIYVLSSEKMNAVQKVVLACTTLTLILIVFGQRLAIITMDTPVKFATCKIQDGALKGLYVTEDVAKEYMDVTQLLRKLEQQNSGERVYISGWLMWAYCNSSLRCGSSGVWSGPVFPTSKLDVYYDVNPQNAPSIILLEKFESDEGDYRDLTNYEYRVGSTLLNLFNQKGYSIQESEYAIAYVLNE